MRIDQVLQRIQGEYVEMPGLRLTAAQAQRLWGLDAVTCEALMAALEESKFLRRTEANRYVRIGRAEGLA